MEGGNMKTLQNNYTTREQAKRLLELGVPKESADCYFAPAAGQIKVKPSFFFYPDDPRWSAGRLIEIYNICANSMPGMQLELDSEPESCTYIEMIIASFEFAADDGLLDFSKLEE